MAFIDYISQVAIVHFSQLKVLVHGIQDIIASPSGQVHSRKV